MQFELTEDQQSLRDMVRGFLTAHAGRDELRRAIESDAGHDPTLWSRMAGELGLLGLAMTDEYGGSDATLVELSVVMHEMGRVLLRSPFFASVGLAGSALQASDDDASKSDYLPRIADGSLIATLAYAEDADGGLGDGEVRCTAAKSGDGWSVSGEKKYVIDGDVADLIFVTARTDAGVSVFAIEYPCEGMERTSAESLDPTRRLAKLTFQSAPARLVGTEGNGRQILDTTLKTAGVLLSAELAGVGEAALEMAVDYANARVQFDRPIGSFQAIKHKASNMFWDVETSRAAAMYAAGAVVAEQEDAHLIAEMTLAHVSDAAFRTTAELLQILGGIGYTWEHDGHLYFKRAKTSSILLGSSDEHREAALSALGV